LGSLLVNSYLQERVKALAGSWKWRVEGQKIDDSHWIMADMYVRETRMGTAKGTASTWL
jgi:hypothetical protein